MTDLLRTDNISTCFAARQGVVARISRREAAVVRAVDEVDIAVGPGEIVGLVGESGCGKTTLGRTILGLVPASDGAVTFDGVDITSARGAERRALRRRMQMIFQDPYASLSPRMRVSALLTEPYRIHNVPPADRYSVGELLAMVGLSEEQAQKYPHELSGGQARRIGIARTLALRPSFIIADEPTSGLDVSAAAAVLNLLHDLRAEHGLAFLVITHNVSTLAFLADRVAVMYLGRIVETGTTVAVLQQPSHPYTRALLAAVPVINPDGADVERAALIDGDIPSPLNPPSGCRFRTRCPHVRPDVCEQMPVLADVSPGHAVACNRWPAVKDDEAWNTAGL